MNKEKRILKEGVKEMKEEIESLNHCINAIEGRIKIIEIQEMIKDSDKFAKVKSK